MSDTRYIGDSIPVTFRALLSDGTPANLTGAKLWSGLKTSPATADPPIAAKKSSAFSGGGDTQIAVTDLASATFTAYYTPTDTASLVDGTRYWIDGHVELADGTRWTAGLVGFLAKYPVQRTPPA